MLACLVAYSLTLILTVCAKTRLADGRTNAVVTTIALLTHSNRDQIASSFFWEIYKDLNQTNLYLKILEKDTPLGLFAIMLAVWILQRGSFAMSLSKAFQTAFKALEYGPGPKYQYYE